MSILEKLNNICRKITLGDRKTIKSIAKQVKGNVPEIVFSCAEAISGDSIAYARLMYLIGKKGTSIPDAIFHSKLDEFLRGVFQDEEDRAKMRALLASEGDSTDNCMQIMSHINNAASKKKIKYLINATRFALAYDLSLPLYFRVCDAINAVMEDDLQYLADHIMAIDDMDANHFEANIHTQKLFSVAAMRNITVIQENGDYAFTPFARVLDACTVSFCDDARYPNPRKIVDEFEGD